jgi:2-dehydropantoate 2-reductase
MEEAPGHRLSALQDLERRKRLEVEETLGFAVQEAARLNIDAPTLATCYTLIAGVNGANVASTLDSD